MRVKHWSGYGCVEAVCLHRGRGYVVIQVRGNHEQGLEPRYFDERDWERWLGKRFKVGAFDRVDVVEDWDESLKQDVMEVTFIKEV